MFVTLLWAIILLTTSPKRNKAKFFLGIFMLVTFLLFLSHTFYYKNQIEFYWFFDLIFIFSSLTVYPLYFCYIKLLTIEPSYNIKNFKVMLPALIVVFFSTIVYLLMSPEQRLLYVTNFLFEDNALSYSNSLFKLQATTLYIVPIIYILQIIYTGIKVNKFIKGYNSSIADFYSNIDDKTINWAMPILYSFIITSVISVVFSVLGRHAFIESTLFLLIPSASFSILLFYIGYLGNTQNHIVSHSTNNEISMLEDIEQDEELKCPNKLKENLIRLFEEEHIYTNPELQIIDLANMLGSNRTYISNIINKDLTCSFSRFVNQYRIQKAKEILEEDITKQYTIEYISQEVGFGTQHSFIRVFKEFEGITPGVFRDKIHEN